MMMDDSTSLRQQLGISNLHRLTDRNFANIDHKFSYEATLRATELPMTAHINPRKIKKWNTPSRQQICSAPTHLSQGNDTEGEPNQQLRSKTSD